MISLDPIKDLILDGTSEIDVSDELGFVVSRGRKFLTYITSLEYAELANSNESITAVLWDSSLGFPVKEYDFKIVRVSNAAYAFGLLHNSQIADVGLSASSISNDAEIHKNAWVSPVGVKIAAGVVIEAHAAIFPNTEIGERTVIRSGAQIGTTALDIKESPNGELLTSKHFGSTKIANDVEIGNNSVIDRAIFEYEETSIGEFTKIGSLVNISHGVKIGAKNKIAAGVQICGYTLVGEENWIGPGVIISHMRVIGSNTYLSLGSIVLQNIEDGWKVVGNKIFKDRKLF